MGFGKRILTGFARLWKTFMRRLGINRLSELGRNFLTAAGESDGEDIDFKWRLL